MRAEVYWIPVPTVGRLGIGPRPRGGDWLEDEVKAWEAEGVELVVSLLTQAEVAELELAEEPTHCANRGIAFLSLPIVDRATPDSLTEISSLSSHLADRLKEGSTVFIHCRQGIGRSTLLAASILVTIGKTADESLSLIEQVRGRPVPDTPEQREWVQRFALAPTSSVASQKNIYRSSK